MLLVFHHFFYVNSIKVLKVPVIFPIFLATFSTFLAITSTFLLNLSTKTVSNTKNNALNKLKNDIGG